MSFVWERAFGRLQFARPEPALREISAHLRAASEGRVSIEPQVLLALAQMIDPHEKRPAAKVKLDLRRLEQNAPPVEPNYERRKFLEEHIDVRGEKAEAVVSEAIEKFGGSRAQCLRDLKAMREYREVMADFEQFLALAKAPPTGRSQ